MKFLVVGLGSMGKRRIRCLKTLGFTDITGVDLREDRRQEVERLHSIPTLSRVDQQALANADAVIISTPPNHHAEYLKAAVEAGKHVFVEASVVDAGLSDLDALARKKGVIVAPSCTLRFHPAVKQVASLVAGGTLGKVANFSYHSGQYLPDWHPWEKVADYYVSNPETGGAREIVPFELTWLTEVFGWPSSVNGARASTMDVGAAIHDTYVLTLTYPRTLGVLIVDVVARAAIRRLLVNMERGQITWDWGENAVRVYESDTGKWVAHSLPEPKAAAGYNKNIAEQMYVDEIASFVGAISGADAFPNSLQDDIRVLNLLYQAEDGRA
jgi:predicted dehydrogenase